MTTVSAMRPPKLGIYLLPGHSDHPDERALQFGPHRAAPRARTRMDRGDCRTLAAGGVTPDAYAGNLSDELRASLLALATGTAASQSRQSPALN